MRDALLTVMDNVGHYEAMKAEAPYIVWAEDSQAAATWADNRMQNQGIQGTIDLYTTKEYDPAFKEIQNALNVAGISFYYNSSQREEVTGYIHHEWVFEIWLE